MYNRLTATLYRLLICTVPRVQHRALHRSGRARQAILGSASISHSLSSPPQRRRHSPCMDSPERRQPFRMRSRVRAGGPDRRMTRPQVRRDIPGRV